MATIERTRKDSFDFATMAPHLVWWGTIFLLCVTVFYPSVVLVANSFRTGDHFSLANFVQLFQTPRIYTSMINSFKVVIPATLLGTALGVVLAWIVARTNLPGKRIWQMFLATPYLIPPFVGAISWTYLLGPIGLVNKWYMELFNRPDPLIDIYTIGGMIFVMAIYGYTIPYIVVLPAIQKIDAAVEEAGTISGASKLRIMKDITLPLIAPAILGGMLLLFMNLLADFGIPAVLGAPKRITLMTTQIYQLIVNFDMPNHLQIAAANSMLLAVFGLIGLQIYQKIIKSGKYAVVSGKGPSVEPIKLGKWSVPVYLFLMVVVLVTTVAPIAAAIFTSLIKAVGVPATLENLTLRNYRIVFDIDSIKRAMINSVSLSAAAGLLITFLGLILAYMIVRVRTGTVGSRIVESLIAIPYAVPGTIVGLAMILAFASPLPVIGINLYGTYWILLIAYLSRFMNIGLQTITGAMTQIHPSLEEACRISGATQMQAFKHVVFPLLRPSIYAAFFLVIMPALGEITLSSLLWSVNHETIGVVVLSLQEEGKVTLTASLAVVLMLSVFTINLVLRTITKGKLGL